MTMISMGTFRTAEEEMLDVTSDETKKWLKAHYPAVMAERPVGMSEGYQFMSSHKMCEILQEQFDIRLVSVSQQWSRARDPRGQEHVMRFRYNDKQAKSFLKEVGDSVPELVIINSHNGRSCARAYAGVFRLICTNVMVVGENESEPVAIRHFGQDNGFEAFEAMLKKIAQRMEMTAKRVNAMQSVIMTRHDENQLAKLMLEQRKAPKWLTAKDVLKVNRPEDDYDEDGNRNMWITFNVLQENLTNKRIQRDDKEADRLSSIRPLSGARAQLVTNAKLWDALEDFIAKRKKRMPEALLLPAAPKEAAKPAKVKAKEKA